MNKSVYIVGAVRSMNRRCTRYRGQIDVNEVEELTGTLITAKTSAKEVTAITRQYLAAIGK